MKRFLTSSPGPSGSRTLTTCAVYDVKGIWVSPPIPFSFYVFFDGTLLQSFTVVCVQSWFGISITECPNDSKDVRRSKAISCLDFTRRNRCARCQQSVDVNELE